METERKSKFGSLTRKGATTLQERDWMPDLPAGDGLPIVCIGALLPPKEIRWLQQGRR